MTATPFQVVHKDRRPQNVADDAPANGNPRWAAPLLVRLPRLNPTGDRKEHAAAATTSDGRPQASQQVAEPNTVAKPDSRQLPTFDAVAEALQPDTLPQATESTKQLHTSMESALTALPKPKRRPSEVERALRQANREAMHVGQFSLQSTIILFLVLLAAASMTVWLTHGIVAPESVAPDASEAHRQGFTSDAPWQQAGVYPSTNEPAVSPWMFGDSESAEPTSALTERRGVPTMNTWPPTSATNEQNSFTRQAANPTPPSRVAERLDRPAAPTNASNPRTSITPISEQGPALEAKPVPPRNETSEVPMVSLGPIQPVR